MLFIDQFRSIKYISKIKICSSEQQKNANSWQILSYHYHTAQILRLYILAATPLYGANTTHKRTSLTKKRTHNFLYVHKYAYVFIYFLYIIRVYVSRKMILILDTTTTQNPGNTRAWRLCGKVEWSQFEASDFLSSISQRKRSLWSAIVQHTHNNMRVLQILDTIFDVAVDAIFLHNQISFWV